MSMRMSSYYNNSAFRRLQLPTTLRFAFNHAFYRQHWDTFGSELTQEALDASRTWELLQELPIITRAHLAKEIEPRLSDDDEIVGISFSSGTTGTVVCRFTSAQEGKQIAALSTQPAASRVRRSKPLHVEFITSWHGVASQRATHAILLPGTVMNDARVMRTVHMMSRDFRAPGIDERASVISGSVPHVYAFTRYLSDHGMTRADFRIKAVGVYGGYLGKARRQWMTHYWDAPVVDSFSASECRGKGFVCPHCGHIAFDPQIIPVTLALNSNAAVHSGVGRLTLTELYPFGIVQPIIKYLTNDLVEWLEPNDACCPEHVGGLRRLGRLETSLITTLDGQPRLLLPSQTLYDVFDRAGVYRADPHTFFTGIQTNDLGQPYVEARLEGSDAGPLKITARYRPESNAPLDLSERLQRDLSAVPWLAPLVAQGRLSVSVVADEATPVPPTKFA